MNTKNLILVFLFVITSTFVYSQKNETKNINDTTLIFGVVTEDSYVGKDVSSYCSVGYDRNLPKKTIVLVCGTKRCTRSYSNEGTDFFLINYNKKLYYIEKEKLFLKDYTFDEINNMNEETAQKFKEYSNSMASLMYDMDVKEALNFLNSCKPYGLVVYDWEYYDESEYTDGTSARITVYNPTNKTIKYLWFNFIGYNPVGDRVVDRVNGTSIITKKGVGPIAKGETGTYEFEYLWFTDIVETAKISSIKVQYMDGTIKTINNPKTIMLSDKYRKILEETDE